jgi:hypothetical protein
MNAQIFILTSVIIIQSFFLVETSEASEVDPRKPTLGIDGRLCKSLIFLVDKDGNDVLRHWIVGINSFGQVSLLADGSNAEGKGVNLRLGPQYTAGVLVEVSNINGNFIMDLKNITAGSALIMTGHNGRMANLHEVPRQLRTIGDDIVGIVDVGDLEELPITEERMRKWRRLEFLAELIETGQLIGEIKE